MLATPMEFQRLLALELLWSASLSDFSLDASLDRRPSDLHLFLSPSLSLIGSTTLPAVRCFVSLAMLTMSQFPHQGSAQGSRPTEPNRDRARQKRKTEGEGTLHEEGGLFVGCMMLICVFGSQHLLFMIHVSTCLYLAALVGCFGLWIFWDFGIAYLLLHY